MMRSTVSRRNRTGWFVALAIASCGLSAQVFVDQAGYRPLSAKYTFTTSTADSFAIVQMGTNSIVRRGPLVNWKSADPATGMTLRRGDFSDITQTGRYRVETSSGVASPAFTVHDSIPSYVARLALKGFYFQRCGTALSFTHAGWWLHGYCHTADATFHATAESTGTISAAGGWHDAGDYGKYVVNAGITVGTLLLAYDLYPEQFGRDDTGIPESGNGVPDLLDEVRFELEWMLRMQSGDGGVFTKLTKAQFESFVMPQSDVGTRYIYQISSTATGDLAAVAARASRTFQAFDPVFAARCRTAAEKAWGFLSAHPSIVPAGGFVNPAGTATGEYGDSDDRDERLWAAAELFAATGFPIYETAYDLGFADQGLFGLGMSWQTVTPLAHIAYLFALDRTRDAGMLAELRASLKRACDTLMARRSSSGFHLTLVPGEFVWGSNASVLNNALLLILGARALEEPIYLDGAEDQLHYILGVNPHAMSFVTGIGAVRPMFPHHRPSGSDTNIDPVPGLLAGGPCQYGGDPELSARFSSATPPALWYVDDQDSYASNEICINWNAPLVFVAGALSNEGTSSGADVLPEEIPTGSALFPVYPNPFNPSTTVRFRSDGASLVTLDVWDVTGRSIERLVERTYSAGEHATTWNAGRHPSGVYILHMTCGRERHAQKVMLLR